MNEGKRYDFGKSRMSLIPFVALRALGDVYAYGECKYASWNWAKGMAWSRMADAMLRHYERFSMGEARDPESGLLHSAHMAWNAIGLLTYELLNLGEDDRWKEHADYLPEDYKTTSTKSYEELDPTVTTPKIDPEKLLNYPRPQKQDPPPRNRGPEPWGPMWPFGGEDPA
jgi:hypothetical protein